MALSKAQASFFSKAGKTGKAEGSKAPQSKAPKKGTGKR